MKRTAIVISGVALCLMAVSCKGRTNENVEVTGDTVELEIGPDSASAESDSGI